MKKLLYFLQPYKNKLLLMIGLLFIQVMGTLYIPTLTADIVNNGIVAGDLEHVWKTGGIMLLTAVATAAFSILGTYTSTAISTSMGKDIRGALFRKAQEFSINDFNRFGAASLITRSTSDVTQIQVAFSIIVEMLLPAPFMTIAGLILAFSKNRLLAFTILGFMLAIIAFVIIMGKKVIPIYDRLQKLLDKINRTVRESIIGVRVIRAFNRTGYEKKRTDQTFHEYADTAIKANKIFAVMVPFVMVIMNICTLMIIWIGGRHMAKGGMEIGDIMAIIEYAMLTLMYLLMGVAVFIFIPRAQICANRINAVLETEPEPAGTIQRFAKGNPGAIVEFRNVTFRYAGAEEVVLKEIDFTVEKGKTTAIIGSTGSGKSTIASLLMRFYDFEKGNILIDGKDVREYPQEELRDKIGYVPQNAFLFSGTIADNLRHGKKDATEKDMHHAAKIAQIDDFITSMEKGLDSQVSQGGSNFSGGQRQRLSIARAIIRKPDIYIFDDSFSALDFKTDARLRKALKQEVADSAVIIVAQRISTILDADQIIVLDEGRIVGKGTHKELLEDCPVYQQIAWSQLSEEELA
ncbi:ABC transporter ATP-binding protein [[Clostridium] scindens]|uniref:ABC transporter ATP-binding protein n=1 Tax=Clostridium scindens (strain JCM 10418 / VPI 12708) TaxID=29347 RepID=UPI001D063B21|nr:ABC transporter ATP-binding protein [[Clostridium] scindens]MCB6285644.1 ABC transporter ATP-binding protein/permease [[Clostridium] scindens]MCB7192105.1 ABC transporter ATP-binding protein/permease [[Clostridium] scindens]MCB7285288.1 ABC transporter ATP-binding protein/permease [[Clostridium] scindens]MCQ5286890.1 ABC transporter ATP-binding protein/permease [[Clostridium] scindens]